MAGGHTKYRHLSRPSAHRQALLRNLVTSLFTTESITTTFAKAKEAQRLAEKLITLGKKNTIATRQRASQIFYSPLRMVPRLFDEVAPRYANRPGGCTRVQRLGPRQRDAAESAVLSLVDGKRDMKMYLTAQTVARDKMLGVPNTARTEADIHKCTNPEIRGAGAREEFETLVKWFVKMEEEGAEEPELPERNVGTADRRTKDVFYPRETEVERKYLGRERVKGLQGGKSKMFPRLVG